MWPAIVRRGAIRESTHQHHQLQGIICGGAGQEEQSREDGGGWPSKAPEHGGHHRQRLRGDEVLFLNEHFYDGRNDSW